MTKSSSNRLMTPGPVPLPSFVKKSLSLTECHHRSKEFAEIFARVRTQIKQVFQTENHCYLLPATGSGGLEAAVVNSLKQSDKLLSINAGKFGARWGDIASAYRIECDELDFEWGKNIDLNRVEKSLASGKYQALSFQACETSTGALLPVRELAELCHRYNVLSIVDGITALGAIDIPVDAWNIDILIGGSQKAFMLPTGMSFLSCSAKVESVGSDVPKFYWDLAKEKTINLTNKTNFSTPTHMIVALDLVLHHILQEVGLKNHFKNILNRAEIFRQHVQLPLFPEVSSASLSCLKVPKTESAKELKMKVQQDGFIIVAGQGPLEDRVVRVGHMGDMSEQDLIQTAESINNNLS